MNKQDKIKKVMREFKDGKLKTPNGEVVTDKKQALAIAMSESEDYAEKADLIEDISIISLSHAEDVIKSIGSEELFEKAVYADTSENRKLGRVGQEYHRGKGKKEEKKVSGGKNSWGYEIKPEYSNNMSKVISKKFGKYLDGEDGSMEFIDSYWKSVANGADEKVLQNSLKHAIHDRVSPGSNDAEDTFKEAMANIKHYEKESQKHYKIKKKDDSLVGDNGEINEDNEKVKRWRELSDKYNSVKERNNMTANEIAEMANIQREIMKQKSAVKKSFDDEMGISDAYRELFGDDLEKAHQDGDMHPNGKWVWVSSANGGKGDWRTLNGRTHKKHSETQASNKFLENFKNASDDVLEKIVSGKIQAVDREKKLAQQILDSRKKSSQDKQSASSTQNAHVQKLIDTYKISNNSYTDTSKMSIVVTPKGNWNLRYDGKDVSTISGQRNIMDRKTLEAAGIKFDEPKKRPVGAGTNGPTPKTKADKKVDDEKTKFTTKDYEIWGHESSSTVKGYGIFNPDTNLAAVVRKDKTKGGFSVTIKKQDKKHVAGPVVETKSFPSRAEAMKYGIKRVQEKSDSSKNEKFEVKNADRYDKGTGQIGDYSVPRHQHYPAQNLYYRLKNNRHFVFANGLDDNAIMNKLREHDGSVKISYSNNGGGSFQIYRIEFLKNK